MPTRLLYLSNDGPMGGSARQLGLLLSRLDRRRYEPAVVCHLESTAEELRRMGVETHVRLLPLPGRWPLSRRSDGASTARFAAALGVTLVHANKLELGGYLARVARDLGVPSVLHVRTPLLPPVRWKAWARRVELPLRLARLGCHDASAVVAISARIERQLRLGGVASSSISIVEDAVDVDRFRPGAVERGVLPVLDPHGRAVRVGMVGRVEPGKRQLDFVEAARRIIGGGRRDVAFYLVGNAVDPRYQRRVAEAIRHHRLEEHVILTGGRDDMPQVMRSLDVLVSLSGGSVLFEGMASGTAVLSAGFSTRDTALHLQDGRTGLLVTSRGIPELVSAMLRLIDDADLRRTLGRQARTWAEGRLTHVAMAERMQAIYDRLLEDRTSCAGARDSSGPMAHPALEHGTVARPHLSHG